MSDNSGFNFKIYLPVEVDKSALELSRYPDFEFISYLIDSLKYGFDTGINPLPDKSIVCKNLRSALSQPECAAYLISEELKYLIGPFVSIFALISSVLPKGNTVERKDLLLICQLHMKIQITLV